MLAGVSEQQPEGPPRSVLRRSHIVALVAVIVVSIGASAAALALAEPPTEPNVSNTAEPSPSATRESKPPPVVVEKRPPTFNKTAKSIDDPNSLWVVANKVRPLEPLGHIPPDLVGARVPYVANATMRAEAAAAMEKMVAAAAAEGAGALMVQNAYRSYDLQVQVYNNHVNRAGVEQARTHSAMPGFSEHQTGLSADIMGWPQSCSIQACFGATPQGAWLAEHAWRFGYHLRYPEGKTDVTGYVYEPWHFRYVGPELATELRVKGIVTLEEFFNLPPAPDYAPGT